MKYKGPEGQTSLAIGKNRGNKLDSTERSGERGVEPLGGTWVNGEKLLWGFKPESNRVKRGVK